MAAVFAGNRAVAIETVPASQQAGLNGEIDEQTGLYQPAEWISEQLGLAATSDTLDLSASGKVGRVYVWSLHSARVMLTIELPARVERIIALPENPIVAITGGSWRGGHEFGSSIPRAPFVWIVNLETGEIVAKTPLENFFTKASDARRIRGGFWGDGQRDLYLVVESFKNNEPDYVRCQWNGESVGVATNIGETKWRRSIQPSEGKVLPSWSPSEVVESEHLILIQEGKRVALRRKDTSELVITLGREDSPLNWWTASPDGSALLAQRQNAASPTALWDLHSLKLQDLPEKSLATPAFTTDGEIIRYLRERADKGVDVVSNWWRSHREIIDRTFSPDETGYSTESKKWRFDAEFSDDGSAFALFANQQLHFLTWPTAGGGPPKAVVRPFSVDVTGGITDSRGIVTAYGPDLIDFDTRLGRTIGRTPLRTMGLAGEPRTPLLWTFAFPGFTNQLAWYRCITGSDASTAGTFRRTLPSRSWSAWGEEGDSCRGAAVVHPLGSQREVLLRWDTDHVSSYRADTGDLLDTFISRFPTRDSHYRLAAPLAGRFFLPLDHGGVQLLDVRPDGHFSSVAQLWSTEPGSWLVVLPDGRYAVSPSANPPLFFQEGNRLFPFEELDSVMNQPDAVADALGASPEIVARLRAQRLRRVARLGNIPRVGSAAPRPTFVLTCTPPILHDGAALQIEGDAKSVGRKLAALNVFVNDVPVYGREGRLLSASADDEQKVSIEIPLTFGSNKIQIGVRDADGLNSIRETFFVHRTAVSQISRRFIVAVGVSDYDDPQIPKLNYAAKDARDAATGLAAATRGAKEVKTLILTDKFARRSDILQAKSFLQQTRPNDEVIIYVAGHGVIDPTGNYLFCPFDFNSAYHANGLSYADLEGLFDGIPAISRLLLMDSCHAGELTDEQVRSLAVVAGAGNNLPRGVRAYIPRAAIPGSPPSETSPGSISQEAQEVFLDLRRTTGATVLAASAGVEFSFEQDNLRNGLFTYALLRALEKPATDADNDGTITAGELVQAVSSGVSAMTREQQHPNARFINLASDFPIATFASGLPPVPPQEIIARFFERSVNAAWVASSSAGRSQDFKARLGALFANVVVFSGDKERSLAVEAYLRELQDRFKSVKFPWTLQRGDMIVDRVNTAGEVTARFTIKGNKYDEDTIVPQAVDLVLKPMGNDWKIVGLSFPKVSPLTSDPSADEIGGVLQRLVEWSSGAAVEPDARLESCFATKVIYFDKVATWSEIAEDTRKYNARFERRNFRLEKIISKQAIGNDEATVRYQMHAEGILKASHELKIMDLTMEARLRQIAGKWKLISLRTIANSKNQ